MLQEIATIVGIISTISALPIFKLLKNWASKRATHKVNRIADSVTKANKELVSAYEREHNEVVGQINTIENALVASMHDRIYQEGNRLLNQGYATVDQIDNFLHMYNAYHDDLGGNGTGEAVKNHVVELPIHDGQTRYVKEAQELHEERKTKDN